MAPPCPNFPPRQLSAAAQLGADGKIRKTEDGRRIDLARDCELFGLVQYECIVQRPELPDSPVQCWPVQRWFRRWVYVRCLEFAWMEIRVLLLPFTSRICC